MKQVISKLRRWLWPVRFILRTIGSWPQSLKLRPIISQLYPNQDGIYLCYLSSYFPERPSLRAQHTSGGAVKMTYLAETFPHVYPTANILYVVSSVTHPLMTNVASGARRKGLRIVLNQNGVAYPAWHGPGWQATNRPMRVLMRMADYVIYQSNFCKLSADHFIGHPKGQWEVIYNPVDTQLFFPTHARSDSQELVLLLGGNQYEQYRFELAIRSLAIVATYQPNVRLIVTGKLWSANQTEAVNSAYALIRRLAVENKVEFSGTYTQQDAPLLFNRAHILLHTKYNDPCPTLVLEAMACGLPVVYSASGGTPELVGNEAGVGIPTKLSWEHQLAPTPQQFAEAIMKVVERQQQFSEAARQRTVDYFSLEKYIIRHQKVFEEVLKL